MYSELEYTFPLTFIGVHKQESYMAYGIFIYLLSVSIKQLGCLALFDCALAVRSCERDLPAHTAGAVELVMGTSATAKAAGSSMESSLFCFSGSVGTSASLKRSCAFYSSD